MVLFCIVKLQNQNVCIKIFIELQVHLNIQYGIFLQAVKDAKSVGGFSTKIEVECRSLSEAQEATLAGADIIMLDNFEPKVSAFNVNFSHLFL